MKIPLTESLHILLVTNNYTPYSGGVVSSLITTRAALEAMGHRVMIVTLDFLGETHVADPNVIRLFCPLRFKYKKNYMAVPWRPAQQIKKIIAQLRPDIIHTHHPFLLGQSALKAARSLNIPIVFTYHTLYQEYAHYVPFARRITRFFIAKIVNKYCQSVDQIIAPSEYVQRSIQRQAIATPVHVIPTGLQPLFLPAQPPVKTNTGHKPFHLLCVSRFVPEKNITALLDVFAHLIISLPAKQFALTLIGYGYHYELLQKYAYDILKLSPDQVQFIHKPSQDIIARYYRTADLFLFSSSTDTQGLVLAEAMAGGMPVVSLDGPGQRSIIRNGYNGFLVHTVAEMSAMIYTIANDPSLYQHLNQGAWQTAQEYTPDAMARKLLKVYDLCKIF